MWWTTDPTTGERRPINLHWGEKYWGYRHIQKDHGWGPLDSADVGSALLLDRAPVPDARPNAYRYYYMYTDGGTQCTRKVVVDFTHHAQEVQQRDVITSFAYPGWVKK